jgi:hypothetical protein
MLVPEQLGKQGGTIQSILESQKHQQQYKPESQNSTQQNITKEISANIAHPHKSDSINHLNPNQGINQLPVTRVRVKQGGIPTSNSAQAI